MGSYSENMAKWLYLGGNKTGPIRGGGALESGIFRVLCLGSKRSTIELHPRIFAAFPT